MYNNIVNFIRSQYGGKDFIPLHEPRFIGNENKYLTECIDSSFVSYVGKFVERFEQAVAEYTGSKYAVAAVNGTSALHIALLLAGVQAGDEVITQPLTFVATCNAISYCGAKPVFVDVDKETLGMSPYKLAEYLKQNTLIKEGRCYNIATGKSIKACLPVHTFGHPCKIDEIKEICDRYHIALVEDAAESLGSFYKGRHSGTYGSVGIFSFNGNKIITTGGGGMLITDDKKMAVQAKHITTTAKLPSSWEYVHNEVGYNYRMPNINAALGAAQIENIDSFLKDKRELAAEYTAFFKTIGMPFYNEPEGAASNYWLNSVVLKDVTERNSFLEFTNANGVMTRPVWRLMHKLEMYRNCQAGDLSNALWLEDRVVNIPSSVRLKVS